ncbi:hypothetical protein KOAAANKH_03571 [Brevundimonas sp. NIBR10]|uniref:DUF2059 domain-containing protein n=1 Tax=Brevundimonas sp. NIBR10 TaxID=3015997 RepID=UPI0022F17521|nr:DUF2059 domain-containing protein [Brevundimonas sp. NIBR10]WGM48665.1 hypothetical protein KOAAANKH_03571 [Brevundimonas sp. NIBR10]
MRDEAAVRLELSRRFIAAIQSDQMGAMLGQMTVAFTPPAEGLSDEQQAALRRATAAATAQMSTRLFDAMAPIYADIFTLEELSGLVAFYESDIGRSMMTKNYAAAPRITEVVVGMMPEMMQGMADSICKDLGCTAEERAQMDAAIAASPYGSENAAPAPASRKSN